MNPNRPLSGAGLPLQKKLNASSSQTRIVVWNFLVYAKTLGNAVNHEPNTRSWKQSIYDMSLSYQIPQCASV